MGGDLPSWEPPLHALRSGGRLCAKQTAELLGMGCSSRRHQRPRMSTHVKVFEKLEGIAKRFWARSYKFLDLVPLAKDLGLLASPPGEPAGIEQTGDDYSEDVQRRDQRRVLGLGHQRGREHPLVDPTPIGPIGALFHRTPRSKKSYGPGSSKTFLEPGYKNNGRAQLYGGLPRRGPARWSPFRRKKTFSDRPG